MTMLSPVFVVMARVLAVHAMLFLVPAWGTQFYVSSTASPQGDGSIGNPWLLGAALANPNGGVAPGDTILLRGGLYKGRFTSSLKGAPGNPIVVRSYPGEWARIDGHAHVSLLTAVTASDTTFEVSDVSAIHLGTVLRLNNEDCQVFIITGNKVRVSRGWSGTTPIAHPAGSLIGFKNTILELRGDYTNYMDFEVMSSDPNRSTLIPGSDPVDIARGDGIFVAGVGLKLINLIVHDAEDGFFLGQGSADLEVYGCLSYHNGWQGPDRGHGHGMYIQNRNGIKKISDVIAFNNFANGMNGFGTAAPVVGLEFSGVIGFNNGSLRAAGHREPNLYIGTEQIAADLISVNDSFFYQTPGVTGVNMHFGYTSVNNRRLTVTNNHSYGGSLPLNVYFWQNTTVTGNTFYVSNIGTWSSQRMTQFTTSPSPSVNWDRNSYFDGSPAFSNGVHYSINFNRVKNGIGGGILSFPEWKTACNCDSGSQYTPAAPTGVEVYVRPNAYEAGRAHIVVFNWSGVPSVPVDLSGKLTIGDTYEILDAQNYFAGPLVAGVFSGAPVSIPMTLSAVSRPVGNVPALPAHTAPRMGTFILRKKSSSGVTVSVTPPSANLSQLQSQQFTAQVTGCLLYTSPSPRD